MSKRFLQIMIFCLVLCSALSVFASEVVEMSHAVNTGKGGTEVASHDRVLCVDGLKVFQTLVFGAGNGTGAGVFNMQLYEEKNGKVVPVRCEASSAKK